MYLAVGLRPLGRTVTSGAVTFEMLHGGVGELTGFVLREHGGTLEVLAPTVEWKLDVAFWPATEGGQHGGASFEAIGCDFDTLECRHEVISADVLDAWFHPLPASWRR